MSITLLDATADSLTISWPRTKHANRYILEYKSTEDQDPRYQVLSDELTQTQCRKRNLSCDYEYFFRVRAVFEDNKRSPWMDHDDPFLVLTEEEEDFAMKPPYVRKQNDNVIHISWKRAKDAYGYEVQMRENIGGAEWITIVDDLDDAQWSQPKAKSTHGYQFRVRPLNGEYDEAYSHPSDCVIAAKGVHQPPPISVVRGPSPDVSMPAPWCKSAGSQALLVRWAPFVGAEGYELQMRENRKSSEWVTIAANLEGTEVKKKNLPSKKGYQFRLRPLGLSEKRWSGESTVSIASS